MIIKGNKVEITEQIRGRIEKEYKQEIRIKKRKLGSQG